MQQFVTLLNMIVNYYIQGQVYHYVVFVLEDQYSCKSYFHYIQDNQRTRYIYYIFQQLMTPAPPYTYHKTDETLSHSNQIQI